MSQESIALVIVAATVAYLVWQHLQARRVTGDRIRSVSLSPASPYPEPYSPFLAAKGRGQAEYLEEGFRYLGKLDMAHDLRRLPSPEPPRPVEPVITKPTSAVPN